MTVVKLRKGFTKVTELELGFASQLIIRQMTGNDYFTNPVPTLVQVSTAVNEFMVALTEANQGGADKTLVKNQKREVLLRTLFDLGTYVEMNCKDDEAIALTSGYELTKKPTPVGNLVKPTGFVLGDGRNPGSVAGGIDKVANARGYLVRYTTDPTLSDNKWESVFTPNTTVLVEGLESIRKYYFKIAALGTSTNLAFSDTISRVIQ